ncbi:hypothetical protein AX17_003182 [Amanita inopinata Kibby_2008]|nr:hypothetical protein AX17_003182 [Amanita inopinata Kibby_2008]
MATLSRPKPSFEHDEQPSLLPGVPAPFPVDQLQHIQSAQESSDSINSQSNDVAVPSFESDTHSNTPQGVLGELLPSIAYVQKSCLMTLNNLLSIPANWSPIVPDRRHSMPTSSQGSSVHCNELDSSIALQTVVTNLRNRDPPQEMTEYKELTTDADLIQELRTHLERVAPSLEPIDATLSKALVSLLSHFNRLFIIGTNMSSSGQQWTTPQTQTRQTLSPSELLGTLARQLSDLRIERVSSQPSILGPSAPPVLAVEAALLWSRIDEELEAVLSLCKERAENLTRSSVDAILPPQYEPGLYGADAPPDYDEELRISLDDAKGRELHLQASGGYLDEKKKMDLENIAMAIDRLYLVTPQLHNQRVELKSSKLAQMEKARLQGSSMPQSVSRGGEPDVKELDSILDLLSKASQRNMNDQSFILEGGMQKHLEKLKQREKEEHEAFVAELVRHSGSGRLHSQDAVYQPRSRDPHALLTLPEFIREPAPPELLRKDSDTLMTLPEFVREPVPKDTWIGSPVSEPEVDVKGKKKHRTRSLSAPHLPWLRAASKLPASTGSQSPNKVDFDVAYVAENHENLRHILLFLQVTGATPGVDIEVEIPPSDTLKECGDYFIVKSGSRISAPQPLPGCVPRGKKEVKVQNGHFEIKIPTVQPPQPLLTSDESRLPLLDASQLMSSMPACFICASCSLPVVQSSNILDYKDLPSEHWQELVEAWMCHPDQKLHAHIAERSKRGFWPRPHQALVGGSYILFEDASLSKVNLYVAQEIKRGEEWRLVRCICGSVLGRCQDLRQENTDVPTAVYRILKYAIRPISSTSEPARIPLSAYVVEDMIEFVQAHATHRFVVLDEEEERPRIIMWLFKPSIRLAYNTWAPRVSPRSGSIHAAKVLYKLFGPSEEPIDLNCILNKYPGFPQAESLFYPMHTCRQIASLLNESNLAYPESLRTMTGLEVGWLRRA